MAMNCSLGASCLELARYDFHGRIAGFVTGARRLRLCGCNECTARLVQTQQLPTNRLVAVTSTADLPDPHDRIVIFSEAYGMNFDGTNKAVVP